MILLNDYDLPDPLEYQTHTLKELVGLYFPHPGDRTENDPAIFLSTAQVLMTVQELVGHLNIDPVPSVYHLQFKHFILLRDYAMQMGWAGVYRSGNQVILETSLGTQTAVDPTYPKKEYRTLVITAEVGRLFNLYDHLYPLIGGKENICHCPIITSIRYMGPVNNPLPIPVVTMIEEGNLRSAAYDDEVNGISMHFNSETGNGRIWSDGYKGECRLELGFTDFPLEFIAARAASSKKSSGSDIVAPGL